MSYRHPFTTGPDLFAPVVTPVRAERAPAQARREMEQMRRALIHSQVALAGAHAILVALVAAYAGRDDADVPSYVREARAQLAPPH